ncbi:HD domain-containing protein, partial [bacterium]|nr:HD domain-containing protein [bacterium]
MGPDSAQLLGLFGEKRARLLESATPGTAAARALAECMDEAVSALAEAASPASSAPFALFALGGYGAMRLLPHSDIDLLLVTSAPAREVERIVRGVVYPLWDLGLTVGHQVRRPKDQARAVAEDLEILTSFLTARRVAGDTALAEQTVQLAFRKIRSIARRAVRSLDERTRPGSPYLLEPDLKEGAGGQRDIDELVWRGALGAGEPVHACDEALRSAQDAITAARWQLQRGVGRGVNLLALEDAEEYGVQASEVQRALEQVHHALLAVRERRDRQPVYDHISTVRELERVALAPDAVDSLERRAHARSLDIAVPDFSQLMTLRRPALSHRYTVGAHSLRVLALAAQADVPAEVRDALLVAALAHDLGKRAPAPGHAVRSAREALHIARALGLPEEAGADAAALVREHLLL